MCAAVRACERARTVPAYPASLSVLIGKSVKESRFQEVFESWCRVSSEVMALDVAASFPIHDKNTVDVSPCLEGTRKEKERMKVKRMRRPYGTGKSG